MIKWTFSISRASTILVAFISSVQSYHVQGQDALRSIRFLKHASSFKSLNSKLARHKNQEYGRIQRPAIFMSSFGDQVPPNRDEADETDAVSFFRDSKFRKNIIPRRSDDNWKALPQVYVLLFNPRTKSEGIYSLQLQLKDGRAANAIVLFESREDAIRYAGLLEAQDFPLGHVEAIEPHEIAAFANEGGFRTTFIPRGILCLPPRHNASAVDRLWYNAATGQNCAAPRDEVDREQAELRRVRQQLETLFQQSQSGEDN